MELKDIVSYASEAIPQYGRDFVAMFRRPGEVGWRDPGQLASSSLWVFLGLSIAIGSTIASLVFGTSTTLFIATVLILALWLVYATYCSFVCIVLGGRTPVSLMIAESLRVMAAVYVVTNVVALILGVFIVGLSRADSDTVFALSYLGTQILLLSIYLVRALRALNRFVWWRTAILFLLVIPVPLLFNGMLLFVVALSRLRVGVT